MEIKSKEEFPDLLSTVTVKKNTNTLKTNEDAAKILSSSGVSEGTLFEESESSSTGNNNQRYLTIFNLPKMSEADIRGALSAYGKVVSKNSIGDLVMLSNN